MIIQHSCNQEELCNHSLQGCRCMGILIHMDWNGNMISLWGSTYRYSYGFHRNPVGMGILKKVIT